MRHEWVSINKKGALFCFARPVISVFPTIAHDYSQVIKKPMDLGTVETMLRTTLVTNPLTTKNKSMIFDTPLKFCEAVIRVYLFPPKYK